MGSLSEGSICIEREESVSDLWLSAILSVIVPRTVGECRMRTPDSCVNLLLGLSQYGIAQDDGVFSIDIESQGGSHDG